MQAHNMYKIQTIPKLLFTFFPTSTYLKVVEDFLFFIINIF